MVDFLASLSLETLNCISLVTELVKVVNQVFIAFLFAKEISPKKEVVPLKLSGISVDN